MKSSRDILVVVQIQSTNSVTDSQKARIEDVRSEGVSKDAGDNDNISHAEAPPRKRPASDIADQPELSVRAPSEAV
jgi:hypothetical protein